MFGASIKIYKTYILIICYIKFKQYLMRIVLNFKFKLNYKWIYVFCHHVIKRTYIKKRKKDFEHSPRQNKETE